MNVRPRTSADVAACVALAGVVRATDGYPPHLPQQLSEFVASPEAIAAWVAEEDGLIAGHVALHRTTSPQVVDVACGALDVAADRLGVVARLFVHPALRGRGAGGTLLRAATAEALALGLAPVLDVGSRFTPAIALYERHGWRRIGEVTVPFGDLDLHELVYALPPTRPPPA